MTFIVFPYLESWFTSLSLRDAAQNEAPEIQQNRKKGISCHNYSSPATFVWYRPPSLTAIWRSAQHWPSRWDPSLLPIWRYAKCKPPLPAVTAEFSLLDFIGPRSTLVFNLVRISHTFLLDDDGMEPPQWLMRTWYCSGYPCQWEDDGNCQELLLVIEKHRKMYELNREGLEEANVDPLHRFCSDFAERPDLKIHNILKYIM